MADRDPAFQWETEALRASTQRRRDSRVPVPPAEPIEPGWVTIRQAEGATGIPVGTLRRWARQGALPSRSQETDSGARRLVWLDAVLERADLLGRTARTHTVEPLRERATPPPPPPRPQPQPQVEIPGQQKLVATGDIDGVQSHGAEASSDLRDDVGVEVSGASEEGSHLQPQPEPQPSAETGPKPAPPDPPTGTMLVPVDAWNKMLLQLGNLHQAGRELAEARERAAKAETEATFLRERLKELREETKSAPLPAVAEGKRRRWFGGR